MAKDRTEAELRERKEKKEKKRKREENGTAEAEDGVVAKKEKKDKKRKSDVTEAVGDVSTISIKTQDDDEDKLPARSVPLVALVPFAIPLADEKVQKKLLKAVKKAAKHKTLKRGVKECQKAIRKAPEGKPASTISPDSPPYAIAIIAGDISPMDVISHLPVHCEDHNIPYIFVPSRLELGAAGGTKRPTSIVLISQKPTKKAASAEEEKEWDEAFAELHKVVLKAGGFMRA